MRRLILKMSMSLDGFVGGPNGEIDWIFRSSDPESTAWTVEVISQVGLHIMGSRTFEDMRAWWPSSTEVFAAPMNDIPKVVFARSPRGSATTTTALADSARLRGATQASDPGTARRAREWAESRVASGPLAAEIAALKREPGRDILAHGGARFARSLVAAGVVDEFKLAVHPVVLGRGLPLFAELPSPLDLELVASRRFAGGVIAQTYRPRRTA